MLGDVLRVQFILGPLTLSIQTYLIAFLVFLEDFPKIVFIYEALLYAIQINIVKATRLFLFGNQLG